MDTPASGKIKPKRSRSEAHPYNKRQSVIGRVTGTVIDKLTPSWLGDLLSSAKKSKPTTNRRNLEVEGFGTNQPDGSSAGMSSFASQDTVQLNNSFDPPSGLTTVSMVTAPPIPMVDNSFMKNLKPVLQFEDDDASELSMPGSSGSSMVPQFDIRDYQSELLLNPELSITGDRDSNRTKPKGTLGGVDPETSISSDPETSQTTMPNLLSVLSETKPDLPHSRPQMPAASPAPSFSLSPFASPKLPVRNTSILGHSLNESLFYTGQVRYGGRSARKEGNLSMNSPYQTPGGRTRIRATNKQTNEDLHSSTAQRILRALEGGSTPLQDARKMTPTRRTTHVDIFSPSSYKVRSRVSTAAVGRLLSQASSKGPPTSSLTLSRGGSQNAQSDPEVSFRSTNTSQTQQRDSPAMDMGGGKKSQTGGKMKNQPLTRKHGRGAQAQDDEEVEVPDLPTNVTLNVAALPKFNINFGSSSPSTTTSASPAKLAQISESGTSVGSSNSRSDLSNFQFSAPIRRARTESGGCLAEEVETDDFSFQSPAKIQASPVTAASANAFGAKSSFGTFGSNKTPQSVESSPFSSPNPQSGGFAVASELKSGSVMDILGGGGSSKKETGGFQPVSGGFKPAEGLKSSSGAFGGSGFGAPGKELKSGSVMDLLGKSGSSKESSPGSAALTGGFKPTAPSKDTAKTQPSKPSDGSEATPKLFSEKWSCPTCLVNNSVDKQECACCQTKKPSETAAAPKSKSKWTCSSCLVPNEDAIDKCVCCGTSKPSSTEKSSLDTPTFNSFRTSSDKWECSTCLVKNDAAKTACVACTTPKPSQSAAPLPSFASNTGDKWTCDTCLVKNDASKTSCAACTTPKPQSSKPAPAPFSSSSFGGGDKWECSTCLVKNAKSAAKCVACQADKPGGIAAPSGGDKWVCDTCLVKNNADAAQCAACTTPKPGSKGSSSAPTAAKESSVPSGPWMCDTCLVKNKADAAQCLACTAPRPGAKLISQPSITGFKLSGTSAFQFGGDLSSSGSTNTNTTKFGGDLSSSTPSTGLTSSFGSGFGKPAASSANLGATDAPRVTFGGNIETTKPKPQKTVTFSIPPTSDAEKTKTDTDATTKPSFTFGVPTTAASSIPSFQFGGTKSTTVSSAASDTPKSSFTFGSSTAVSANGSALPKSSAASIAAPVFDQTTTTPSFGGFSATASSAGSTPAPASKPVFGTPTTVNGTGSMPSALGGKQADSVGSAQKPGGFTFGSSGNSKTSTAPSFAFGATTNSSTPCTGLSFGSGGAAQTSTALSIPAFGGFGNPAPTASAGGGFTFGQKPGESKPAAGGFTFGATSTPVFGSTTNNNTSGPGKRSLGDDAVVPAKKSLGMDGSVISQTPSLNFGGQNAGPVQFSAQPSGTQQPAQGSAPAFNLGAAAAAAPSFNFAAAPTTNAAAPAAAQGAPLFQFNAGNTSGAPAGRTIKKATRRIKR